MSAKKKKEAKAEAAETAPGTVAEVLGAERVAALVEQAKGRGVPDVLSLVTEKDPVLAAVRLLQYSGSPVDQALKEKLGEAVPVSRRKKKDAGKEKTAG